MEMRAFTLAVVLALLPLVVWGEWSQADREREASQLKLWEQRLSSSSESGEASIEKLGLGVRSMAYRMQFGGRDPRTDELFKSLQSKLLSIPGHAEYYQDRLLKAQELYKTRRDGPSCSEYRDEQMYAFQTLPHLPSPETVRVYGEMLFNDWAPPGNEDAIASEKLPLLSDRSTGGLSRLPIENKPFREALSQANFADAQAAWRQWYEEIKSGKRTFRFVGDPVDYDLEGPAPKETLERIALAAKRDTEREVGRRNAPRDEDSAASGSGKGSPASIGALLAVAGAVIASLVWYFVRRQGQAAAR